jgi:nucleoid DNA-binding protein
MKKEELLVKVSERSKVKSEVAKRVIKSLIKTIGESIQNGEKVTLTGLGTFRIKARKPKPARNLQTGEVVQLPEGKKISFKPSLSFKQLLKKKGAEQTVPGTAAPQA